MVSCCALLSSLADVRRTVIMQTVNTMMYLESPYPTEGKVEVVNMTAQLVDADGTPVPLSDVSQPASQQPGHGCWLIT